MIAVEKGSFGYTKDRLLLNELSFSLEQGQVMCVLGPNGIGKTTLLKCLLGTLQWNTGCTLINGQPVTGFGHRGIGYVPQAHPLAFSYSVEELVLMGRARHVSLFAVPSAHDRKKAQEAMQEVGIEAISQKSCGRLSGGQLQLAFIARALAGDPDILIMDEPESHLDFKNQYLILTLVQRLVEKRGISCIINTHYPENALRISQKTLLLGDGKHRFGNTKEIITEEAMEDYFSIRARILDLGPTCNHAQAFVVLGATERP